MPDTLVGDTFVPDTFVADKFVADTFVPDTFLPDTAPVLGCETPAAITPTSSYTTLSSANFYILGVTTAIRSCFREYRPSYELWSDGLSEASLHLSSAGHNDCDRPQPGDRHGSQHRPLDLSRRHTLLKESARSDGKKLETRIWRTSAAIARTECAKPGYSQCFPYGVFRLTRLRAR